jgi:hypothetical protein
MGNRDRDDLAVLAVILSNPDLVIDAEAPMGIVAATR